MTTRRLRFPHRARSIAAAVEVGALTGGLAVGVFGASFSGSPLFIPVLIAALIGAGAALHTVKRGQEGFGSAVNGWIALGAAACTAGMAAVEQYARPERLDWLWSAILLGGAAGGVTAIAVSASALPRPRAEPLTIPAGDVPWNINAETVEVLLDNVRHLLADEDSRGQSLNSRGAGLLGIAGVLVSLLGSLAKTVVDAVDKTGDVPTAATVLFLTGVALLVASILAVVFGVLRTGAVTTISIGEVDLYERAPFVRKSPTWARGRTMATLKLALVSQRSRNSRKGKWLNRAGALISTALVCVAAAGVTLVS